MNKDIAYPPPQYHLTLAAMSPHAVRHIRRIVRTYALMWEMPHIAEVAELAVSELLANVVRHVPDRSCTVLLIAEEGRLRVEVGDNWPPLPARRTAGPWEESGRGLDLVDLITDAWGVDRTPARPGKTVWFELKA
ncbi:ATP-binding protein [Streptomyces cucumeris]|uniref:ATP-binding protein n=1 Tax=Streptomyces cucumeris TaxID=2962890 RepID=UPI003D73F4AA